ncbi:cms1 ribosomal small subunit [Lambiella insularis]|nr:cms1 ribosomal small subunit [Lambiella insularis]
MGGRRLIPASSSLRVFQTNDSIVAKLFAKHKKLVDAIEYVKSTRMGIAVGTPARIIALMDSGCLSSDELKRIVVDFSNIDQKNRGILDMKETQVPLMQLLTRAELKHRFGQAIGGLDLLFF